MGNSAQKSTKQGQKSVRSQPDAKQLNASKVPQLYVNIPQSGVIKSKVSRKHEMHQQFHEGAPLEEQYVGGLFVLPYELIQEILLMLDQCDLGRLACVNWACNYLSQSDFLWKKYLDQHNIPIPADKSLCYKEYYADEIKFKSFNKVFKHPHILLSETRKTMYLEGFPGWCMAVIGDSLRPESFRQVRVFQSGEANGELCIGAVTNLSLFLMQGRCPGSGNWGLTKSTIDPPSVAYYTNTKEVIGFSMDMANLQFQAWKEEKDGTRKDLEKQVWGQNRESVWNMQWWIVVCICSRDVSITLCD